MLMLPVPGPHFEQNLSTCSSVPSWKATGEKKKNLFGAASPVNITSATDPESLHLLLCHFVFSLSSARWPKASCCNANFTLNF